MTDAAAPAVPPLTTTDATDNFVDGYETFVLVSCVQAIIHPDYELNP